MGQVACAFIVETRRLIDFQRRVADGVYRAILISTLDNVVLDYQHFIIKLTGMIIRNHREGQAHPSF